MEKKGYELSSITLDLTDDEFDIIYDLVCNTESTAYYGLGFDITIRSLKDKLDDARKRGDVCGW